MPQKKIVQDILPSKRRTIRDVSLDDEPTKKSSARPSTSASRADRGIRVPIHLEHAAAEEKRAEPKEIQKEAPKEPRKESKEARTKKTTYDACCQKICLN